MQFIPIPYSFYVPIKMESLWGIFRTLRRKTCHTWFHCPRFGLFARRYPQCSPAFRINTSGKWLVIYPKYAQEYLILWQGKYKVVTNTQLQLEPVQLGYKRQKVSLDCYGSPVSSPGNPNRKPLHGLGLAPLPIKSHSWCASTEVNFRWLSAPQIFAFCAFFLWGS